MTVPENNYDSHSNQRGVALVLVLGFLSMMLLVGIAFASLMRTERSASRNYGDMMQAREFLQTGLARALNDLDDTMTGVVYPPNKAIYSQTFTGDPFNDSIEDLLDQEAYQRGFFPGDAAEWGNLRGAVAGGSCEAQSIYDPDPDPTVAGGNKIIGRVGFAIVDGSGMLDFNIVGTSTVTRATGIAPEEIVLDPSLLTELNGQPTPPYFVFYDHIRTLDELNELGSLPPAQVWFPTPVLGGFPDSFATYSKFPTGRLNVAVATPTPVAQPYIGGDVAALVSQRSAIQNGFQQAGGGLVPSPTAAEAEVFFFNLLDYVDADDIPANNPGAATYGLNSICTEAVPMISEVVITNTVGVQVQGTDTVYITTIDIGLELWYPFVGYNNARDYDIQYRITTGPGGRDLVPVTATVPLVLQENGPWTASSPFRVPGRFRAADRVVLPSTDPPPTLPALVRHTLRVVQRDVQAVVDEVVITERWQPSDGYITTFNPGITNRVHGKEVNDPRINWNWTSHWATVSTDSLGATNVSSQFAGGDGLAAMYVANQPMASIGELGFMLYRESVPWETIPLWGSDALDFPIMDYYTTSPTPTREGLVNLNTPEEEVLASVFFESPVEMAPGVQRYPNLQFDATAATTMASILTNRTVLIGAGAVATNLSDAFGRLDDADFDLIEDDLEDIDPSYPGGSPDLTQMERESIVRNSLNLLSARQQLFTIYIQAESVVDRNDDKEIDPEDEVLARQQAVAVVWRDPYSTSGAGYPMEVVHFSLVGD